MNSQVVMEAVAGAVVTGAGPGVAQPRVELGPITIQESEIMFRWFNDPEAARTDYAWRPVDALSHQKWFVSLSTEPSQVWFSIRRREQAGMVGFVVLRHISPVHRSAELGVRIGNAADRGLGLGKEAARLAVEYCWRSLNLERIQVAVLGDNERSLRLYRSLGFEREGVLRRALYIDGAWRDNVIMGLIRP